MNEYQSDFRFLNDFGLNKYYEYMIKIEYISYEYPEISKFYLRSCLEEFLRDIGTKLKLQEYMSVGILVAFLKSNLEVSNDFYSAIQTIRNSIISSELEDNKEENILGLISLMHKIFCEYLGIKEYRYSGTKTMEEKIKDLKYIREDIASTDMKINNLRNKVLELSDKLSNITSLNNVIISIKKQKVDLESKKNIIIANINEHKKVIDDAKENYNKIIKKIEYIRSSYSENNESLLKKHNSLLNLERNVQKLLDSIDDLNETDSVIDKKKIVIKENLDTIRLGYDNIIKFTNIYEDILETIELSNEHTLKQNVEVQKNSISNDLNREESKFYDNINNCIREIDETQRKVNVFSKILDDVIKNASKNREFYVAFLGIKGRQLRILYIILDKFSKLDEEYSFFNKSREWINKYIFNESSVSEGISKSIKYLENISDDEIRLLFYQKLVKLCNLKGTDIFIRKQFIKTLDKLVDDAYNVLMSEEDFEFKKDKMFSIKIYYLKKFIFELNKKYKSIKLSDDLVEKIYLYIVSLVNLDEDYVYSKLKIKAKDKVDLKFLIKKRIFDLLGAISELKYNYDHIVIYKIIFEVLKEVKKDGIFKSYSDDDLFLEFRKSSFRIMLFMSEGNIDFNKENILSLLVSEILFGNVESNITQNHLNSYNEMVNLVKKNEIE